MSMLERVKAWWSPEYEQGLVFNEEHDNDPRNLRYEDIAPLGGDDMPERFELPLTGWVLNQGHTAACTAHAAVHGLNLETKKKASARHLFWKIKTDPKYPSSRLGWGAYLKDAVSCLLEEGTAEYILAPNVSTESDAAYLKFVETNSLKSSALINKGGKYVYVTSGSDNTEKFNAIKRFIWEQKRPVILGVEWRTSFNNARLSGFVPAVPPSGKAVGHAMLAIGWGIVENHEYLIFLNSWGEKWGNKGRLFLPKGYFKISSGLGVIRDTDIAKPVQKPEERNVYQEKADAVALRNAIYKAFPINVASDAMQKNLAARNLAHKQWLVLPSAISYRKWTQTDIINYLYAVSRDKHTTKAFSFDFTKIKSK